MRTFHTLAMYTSLVACVAVCNPIVAQDPSAETGNQLVAPELILQYKEQLKLTKSQQDAIQAMVDDANEKLPAYQAQHKTESQALRDALQSNLSDEKAVLSQLDKVIIQERNIRRLQLALLVRVHTQLSAQQLADIEKIKLQIIEQRRALQQRIQTKFQQAQQLAQQKTAAGSPPTDVVEMMKPFPQLLKDGKGQEAEALLDQALAKLKPADVSNLFQNSDLFSE